jgi:NADH/F420H2 dehydrogenase subunit C
LEVVTKVWEDATADPLVQALREDLEGETLHDGETEEETPPAPPVIEAARRLGGELTLRIRRDAVATIAILLKEKHGFVFLVDLCGADYPDREPRFEVVYHLSDRTDERRLRLKVAAGEDTPVPTVSGVWRAAGWPEREVFDLYGVRFEGHPDLSRILHREGFAGHPLRKDFPAAEPREGAP